MSVKSSYTDRDRLNPKKKESIRNKIGGKREIREGKLTRKVPWLPFTDIDFANNANVVVISIDLGTEVVVDELLVGRSKSEAQGERTEG